jgi:hypothetical protein
MTQDAYYKKKQAEVEKKCAGFDKWAAANPTRLNETWSLAFGSNIYGPFSGTPAQLAAEEARRAKLMQEELAALTEANPDCPNVHNPQNAGCGVHFDLPKNRKNEEQRLEFENKHRDKFVDHWDAAHPDNPVPKGTSINHMTPLDAGGCPSGGGPDKGYPGLVPDHILTGPCAEIEARQTALQGRKTKDK